MMKSRNRNPSTHSKPPSSPKTLLSGAIAGALARTLTNPLERIKILKQCTIPEYNNLSIFQSLSHMWKREGLKGMFKGNGVNVIRVAPFSAFEFYFYAYYKRLFTGGDSDMENTFLVKCVSGGLSGMTSSTLTYPMDVIRTVLAVQTSQHSVSACLQQKTSIKNTAIVMYKTNGGLRAFYKGWLISVAGITPYVAVRMSSFDYFKKLSFVGRQKNPVPFHLLFGGIAGAMGCTVSYPLDLVRRRFQLKGLDPTIPNYKTVLEACKDIYSKDGLRGFFRGLSASYLKVIPSNAIVFMIFELLKSFLA